ncbi:hypothetical protein G6F53_002064 [Rhizopus delemar]|nr:hypothetical protein G6F53_002064 [Rhizopus delemar]
MIAHYKEKHKNETPTAVITGGDSGIGLEITRSLLQAGFHVIIGTRSKTLCKEAVKAFVVKQSRVSMLELDLASFDSVYKFASEVKLELSERKIDVLINNAGIMNVPYLKTEDGFESQCQINSLSPILLTKLLLPCMNTKGSRILFASSSTLYAINHLETDTPLKPYTLNGLDHYAYSKSCIAHLAQHLSSLIHPAIKVYSYHPGTVRTKLFDHTTIFTLKLFSKLFDFIMLTPKEGSLTPLYLCFTDRIELENSSKSCYWADERPQQLLPVSVNGKLNDTKELWKDVLINASITINNITTVQSPNQEYVRLLNHSILFYEVQRSGKLPENNRIPWRHDSAMTDGIDVQLDLTGGYYDAGDYLKFTFPLSYSVFMLSWGGIDYFKGYELANQTGYLKDQLKWATDWMIKAHPQACTLYVQIGDVQLDNNYFGPDSGIPLPRPSYQINETHFGTDVASMTAAAFATASSFFRLLGSVTGNQDDKSYADILLSHSTPLYNFYKMFFPIRYHFCVPTLLGFYGRTDYLDDLILSSIALYESTKNKIYLEDALGFYQSKDWRTNHTEPLSWDNKATILFYVESLLLTLFLKVLTTQNVSCTFNLLKYVCSDDSSNANAMSTSFLLLSYSTKVLRPLLTTPSGNKEIVLEKIKKYEDLANSQLDYIFGKNPAQQNYVVGERPNSPKYPHSALAAGFASLAEAVVKPTDLTRAHTIYGALVGGPAKNDSFADQRLDWAQTEVALDYNACYQGVLAYQVMYNPNGPFYEVPTEVPSRGGGGGSNNSLKPPTFPKWALIITILLPILFVILLGAFAIMFIRRRCHQSHVDQASTIAQDKSEKNTTERP